MNYQIIVDEEKLKSFVEWLPDLEVHESYYVSGFARKKYSPDIKWIKSDKGQLFRFTANSKELIIHKLKQKECPLGSYVQRGDHQPFPNDALAMYMHVNPRDMYKATLHGLSTFAKLIELGNKNHNPHQEILSVIQQTCSRKLWIDFDIDNTDESVLLKVEEFLDGNKECRKVLKTRGGYHILINPKFIPKSVEKTWHKNMSTLADVRGDCMIPIPGAIQGYIDGKPFTPTFID